MNPTFEYILNRLSEKSTWVAIGTFLTGVGVVIKPDQWQAIMGIGMGIGGLVGTLLPARIMEKNVVPAPQATALSDSMKEKTQ